MIKVVYYTDQIYLHGGIEKVLAQKLNYFASLSEYEVHLITTEQKGKQFCYPISDKVIHHDLEINYVREKSYFNPINFKKVPQHIKKLKSTLKKIQPTVLIVCNLAFDFYFIPFISKNIKTVKEFHASRYYYNQRLPKVSFLKKLLFRINDYIESKYTNIVLLNEDEKKYYKSNNLVVIPNAISSINVEKPIKRENVIIAAGRMAQVKQFDHLIKAWSIIEKDFPDWEVQIYGEGDELISKKLNGLISKLSLTNIRLKGSTNNLDIKMRQASIYALSSLTECFPMVLLEALSCGLPIVSYDCPHGPKNIITNNQDGILVEHNNIESFSIELSKFIRNEKLRTQMGITAINNVKRYSEDRVMKKWIQLFKTTIV
ncbi:MAG: hypothetical protein COA67_11185 [Lutibacter sp.]|nr:MAG: hypothetical protein COA67_11185 [Lutibacter sp.]